MYIRKEERRNKKQEKKNYYRKRNAGNNEIKTNKNKKITQVKCILKT